MLSYPPSLFFCWLSLMLQSFHAPHGGAFFAVLACGFVQPCSFTFFRKLSLIHVVFVLIGSLLSLLTD